MTTTTDRSASTPRSSTGEVGSVVGHYRITRTLNTGGMGSVFRAEHELLGKPAAIKLLRDELSTNPEMIERFFNEARAATAIRHPGIVDVFDFGYHEDGRAYLVMEFLEGQTLAARLERGRMTEVAAAVIARGIASALAAAHGRNIIHRDLKPENVFLVPDPDMPTGERPKVLDFGIAKLVDDPSFRASQTQTGALMGTPMYMAPEQARAAAAIDPRADLYSLGCMLYEMLTGGPPFVAEGAGEIIALQMFGVPEPPSAHLAVISPDMDAIVMRLLEKDPEARYQNAFEVVDALSKAIPTLSGQLSAVNPESGTRRPALIVQTQDGLQLPPKIVAPPLPLPQRNIPPTGKLPRPIRPALVAAFGTVAIAGTVIGFLAFRKDDAPARTPVAQPQPQPHPQPQPRPHPQPEPPPPPTPASITYAFRITPAGAAIEVDGAPVTLADSTLTVPSRAEARAITIRAADHESQTLDVPGDQSKLIDVALVPTTRKPTKQVRGKPGPHDRVLDPDEATRTTPTGGTYYKDPLGK
jgi:serine/threonine protein kinase